MSDISAAVARVASVVHLDNVRLRAINALTNIVDSQVRPANLSMQYGAALDRRNAEQRTFTLAVDFVVTIRATDGAPDADPDVFLKAAFELEYKLPETVEPSDDDITAFATTNGVYNAWPYLRELVQNTTIRMGLPAAVIPLYRPRSLQKTETESQTT
jgi:hypothetical protein